ncbi:MAG: hypothetical protein LCH63_15745 [Candidatus Melainabacteria bacterium]|jgi:hypothetical protein|nr:hypothetical protein [Candidatus Melainabacteria bacterium]
MILEAELLSVFFSGSGFWCSPQPVRLKLRAQQMNRGRMQEKKEFSCEWLEVADLLGDLQLEEADLLWLNKAL